MLILNFSHPLTAPQRTQLESLTGQPITEVRHVPALFDNAESFHSQICRLVDSLNLTPEEWQTRPILLVPPAYNFAALTLLAELHGRMGYFPAIVRIRPVPETTPPRYEVAEIINLQAVRDIARKKRIPGSSI
ncbi:MAG: CRISPR-associated protein Csx15 [Chloroflexota bacterium]